MTTKIIELLNEIVDQKIDFNNKLIKMANEENKKVAKSLDKIIKQLENETK